MHLHSFSDRMGQTTFYNFFYRLSVIITIHIIFIIIILQKNRYTMFTKSTIFCICPTFTIAGINFIILCID